MSGYLPMFDTCAEIKRYFGSVNKQSEGSLEEDVELNELHGKLVCTSHLWVLTRSGRELNRKNRLVGAKGLSNLKSEAEVRTATWVREKIFAK